MEPEPAPSRQIERVSASLFGALAAVFSLAVVYGFTGELWRALLVAAVCVPVGIVVGRRLGVASVRRSRGGVLLWVLSIPLAFLGASLAAYLILSRVQPDAGLADGEWAATSAYFLVVYLLYVYPVAVGVAGLAAWFVYSRAETSVLDG